jgi:hypothetical protein
MNHALNYEFVICKAKRKIYRSSLFGKTITVHFTKGGAHGENTLLVSLDRHAYNPGCASPTLE